MAYASRWSGAFRAPRRLMDWFEAQLAGARFRVEAIAIGVLTVRSWAGPQNIGKAAAGEIVLSRNDLAEILGLTPWQVRQGIEALVEIGFVDRLGTAEPARRTAEGIRRPPRRFRLAAWIVSYFRRLHALRAAPPISKAAPKEGRDLEKGKDLTRVAVLTGERVRPPRELPPPTPVLCKPDGDAPGLLAALAALGSRFRLDD